MKNRRTHDRTAELIDRAEARARGRLRKSLRGLRSSLSASSSSLVRRHPYLAMAGAVVVGVAAVPLLRGLVRSPGRAVRLVSLALPFLRGLLPRGGSIAACLLGPLALIHLSAATAHPVRVDDKLLLRAEALAREAIEKEGVPGLSIAVGKDGKLLFAEGWGYADAKRGNPATADTSYEIGSLTRQFTAVGILQLAEKHKLTLDDDLAKWLPDFPLQGHKVTLRHLLANTSGVSGYETLVAKHASDLDRDLTREQLFTLFEDVPFDFTPGTGFSFNNSGYLLLSMVLSKASGEPYTDFVRAHILEPIDLEGTRFYSKAERPVGFAQECRELSDDRELEIPLSEHPGTSTQSLASTVKDLFRWQCAINDRQLIGENSTRELLVPVRLADGTSTGHGFATAVTETEFSQVLSHTGGVGGFRVRLAYYVEQQLTVVVLANCASAPVERIEKAVARAALDLLPAETVDLPIDAEEAARLAGSWQIATQRVLTFAKEGKLWFEYPGQAAFPLMYQGRRVFLASTDKDMRVTFQGDRGESAISFEILRNGIVSIGKRME